MFLRSEAMFEELRVYIQSQLRFEDREVDIDNEVFYFVSQLFLLGLTGQEPSEDWKSELNSLLSNFYKNISDLLEMEAQLKEKIVEAVGLLELISTDSENDMTLVRSFQQLILDYATESKIKFREKLEETIRKRDKILTYIMEEKFNVEGTEDRATSSRVSFLSLDTIAVDLIESAGIGPRSQYLTARLGKLSAYEIYLLLMVLENKDPGFITAESRHTHRLPIKLILADLLKRIERRNKKNN